MAVLRGLHAAARDPAAVLDASVARSSDKISRRYRGPGLHAAACPEPVRLSQLLLPWSASGSWFVSAQMTGRKGSAGLASPGLILCSTWRRAVASLTTNSCAGRLPSPQA